MMNDHQFFSWANQIKLSKEAIELIKVIRASPPDRRTGGGKNNVDVKYASYKMRKSIQAESHKAAFRTIIELEQDINALEFYDETSPIKLIYVRKSKSGKEKTISYWHLPDCFALFRDKAGWLESKTEAELIKRSIEDPELYQLDENGKWCCPPAEAYAKQFGLFYEVKSNADIDWIWQRNIAWVADYLRDDAPNVTETAITSIQKIVQSDEGITLSELYVEAKRLKLDVTGFHTNVCIARQAIFADLSLAPIAEPERVRLYSTASIAAAHAIMATSDISPMRVNDFMISWVIGNRLIWDGRILEIVNTGYSKISLLDIETKHVIELPNARFHSLIISQRIVKLVGDADDLSEKVYEILKSTNPDALADALDRYQQIQPILEHSDYSKIRVSRRTANRYVQNYREAAASYGYGFIGLIPLHHQKGNRSSRLPVLIEEVMQKTIDEEYETFDAKLVTTVYRHLQKVCQDKSLLYPSRDTFLLRIRRRNKYKQVKAREGDRVAYPHQRHHRELYLSLPSHGDRPWEIAHIDHTQLDIECVDSKTGKPLGKPWISIMIDGYSRRILAVYICFERPAVDHLMMLVRICVKRFGRLPDTIVVDGGAEFASVYFEALLAFYGVTKKTRPPARPRFGAIIERLVGSLNEMFIHNLRGNTKIMKKARQVTKKVTPSERAVWDLFSLFNRLEPFLYELYDTREHSELKLSPRAAYERRMWYSGERPNRSIPYNRAFIIQTSLPISRGQAEVNPRRGIRYDYRYFWHDSMDEFDVANKLVFFRYDPFDASLGYAFIRKKWELCRTVDFPAFQGRSEREIALATAELRARNRRGKTSKEAKEEKEARDISDYELAAFLESTQAEEKILIQRMKDREAAPIRQKYSNPDDSQENREFVPVVEEVFDNVGEEHVASPTLEPIRELRTIENYDDDDEILEEF